MKFKELGLIEPILKAVQQAGYTDATPIQSKSIPILLKGEDLLGCAQTGTGKTAAFAIPIIQLLENDKSRNIKKRKIRALIVTPTRELAIQIADNFIKYGKYTSVKTTVIFGGVKQGKQVKALRAGVDVLVATPGRLLDLINQGIITLRDVSISVLDEADQMLDMGFIHDVRRIIRKLPDNRQSLFFSATLPDSILSLSKELLGDPQKVTIKPEQATAEKVEQAMYFVTKSNKSKLLLHLIKEGDHDSVLVFSRTKYGADKIVKHLNRDGVPAEAIHGNKSQGARQRALGNFKSGKTNVMVATDIAARGIDVPELSLVVNYDLPNVAETYVHRIGRTGRANASGIAVSFCTRDDLKELKMIQKLINQRIPVINDHPYPDDGQSIEPEEPKQDRRKHHRNKKKNWGKKRKFNKSSNNKAKVV